jgi:hypothetical protein
MRLNEGGRAQGENYDQFCSHSWEWNGMNILLMNGIEENDWGYYPGIRVRRETRGIWGISQRVEYQVELK